MPESKQSRLGTFSSHPRSDPSQLQNIGKPIYCEKYDIFSIYRLYSNTVYRVVGTGVLSVVVTVAGSAGPTLVELHSLHCPPPSLSGCNQGTWVGGPPPATDVSGWGIHMGRRRSGLSHCLSPAINIEHVVNLKGTNTQLFFFWLAGNRDGVDDVLAHWSRSVWGSGTQQQTRRRQVQETGRLHTYNQRGSNWASIVNEGCDITISR